MGKLVSLNEYRARRAAQTCAQGLEGPWVYSGHSEGFVGLVGVQTTAATLTVEVLDSMVRQVWEAEYRPVTGWSSPPGSGSR